MSENNITIRAATIDDMASLAHLMTVLGYPTTSKEMHVRFRNIKAHPDFQTWVAVQGEEVVGMIGLINMLYYEKNGSYIRVGALVVSDHCRNQGIGKALMQKAYAWATETGAGQVLLNSGNREERKNAHAFYQHLGFEPKTTGFVKTIE